MNLYPMGDYYAWYCDWCDTKNITIWIRVDEGKVTCGACHRHNLMTDLVEDERYGISPRRVLLGKLAVRDMYRQIM